MSLVRMGQADLGLARGISDCRRRLYGDLLTLLEGELQRSGYVGPFGIDAFLYCAPRAVAG